MKRVFFDVDMMVGAVISGDAQLLELNTVRPCHHVDVSDLYFHEKGDYLDPSKGSIVNNETLKEFKIEET